MILRYQNMQIANKDEITVKITPNESPRPFIEELDNERFTLSFNCFGPYNTRNYWNEVTVSLP